MNNPIDHPRRALGRLAEAAAPVEQRQHLDLPGSDGAPRVRIDGSLPSFARRCWAAPAAEDGDRHSGGRSLW